ncbi:HD domain-containing protein [Streptomyces sp. NPDC048275]|uniref:HD domain-containing protein n=1 Tax=Streptomyces sp. NPDC048275 TaxID=3155629 RepID=UPI00340DA662
MTWAEAVGTLSFSLMIEEFNEPDEPGIPDRDADLPQLLDFLGRMDELKHVQRQNPVSNGSRRENTAEHSWHVAFACLLFSRYAAESIDTVQCVGLAVVHDIVEVVEGDTFVYGPQASSRRSREERAIGVLLSSLPRPERESLERDWREYEFTQTAEGRYVMALDVLLPIFMNLTAGEQSSWRRHGVDAAAVRRRVDGVRETIPALARMAYEAIDKAIERGLLKAA